MTRYVISDHHFGHANIIDYCDRPFSSPGEMDDALLGRHHEAVGPDDTLLHLGDVAMDMRDGREAVDRFERLGGGLLVRGNHNVGLDPDDAPFPVVAYDDRRVNVAVELVDYRPVALDALTGLLDACVPGDRLRDVDRARERLPTFRSD
jgi:calcineurin-like phosphoesterase family protein